MNKADWIMRRYAEKGLDPIDIMELLDRKGLLTQEGKNKYEENARIVRPSNPTSDQPEAGI